MPALKGGAPFSTKEVLTLAGERFFVAEDPKTGVRSWKTEYVEAQDGKWAPEAEIALTNFAGGSGGSWEGLPNSYSHADGWDATTPGKLTTWPMLASGESFTSDDAQGWMFQVGSFFYVARGRYVQKYKIDDTPGATWSIVETHDLGSGIVCCGRPGLFKGKAYIPRRTGTTGDLEVFHELTTVVTGSTETQTVTVSGTPTGGTYTLTWDGKTTAAIAYNAAAAAVQSALRLIAGLERVTVADTGTTPNFTHTVTMTAAGGDLGNGSPPQMTVTDSTTGGSHSITIATTDAGTSDTWTAGPSGREMQCFIAYQDKMYGAAANLLYSVADDPLTDADWAPADDNGYAVGNSGEEITDLGLFTNLLLVAKVNGLYTFDSSLQVVNELPDLQYVIDSGNGVGLEFAQGVMYVPHRSGLIQWAPGSYQFVGPNQEGAMDAALSPGWGRVASIAPYGKYIFVAANDAQGQKGAIVSLQPGQSGGRGPVVPHMHQQADGSYEAVRVASLYAQPIAPSGLTTWISDDTVGSVGWGTPTNMAADDGFVTTSSALTSALTTEYLNGQQLATPTIPDGATILGVKVTIKRSAGANS